MAIKKLETTASAAFELMDKTAKITGKEWHSGENHKITVGVWFADACQLKGEERKNLLENWSQTPSWLGCNASQGRQARESKKAPEAMKNYLGNL